jgi:hypothetical protein
MKFAMADQPLEIDADFVLKGLLQHNFLPMQKEDKDELPPIFTSEAFTPELAQKLVDGRIRAKDGFDTIEYKLTRFNGVSRVCSIPHPLAYANLAICIQENWNSIKYIVDNENSMIRPRRHDDGRIIVMDYESSAIKNRRELQSMFSRRFMVRTDISNCFPTIYSHAVPWALIGFTAAKQAKHRRDEWFNQLDERVRWLKRNETQGIAIGPASSNIISEAILARVDDRLKTNSPYVRFIDDYTAYFNTEDEARKFVRELEDELSKYKLLLNLKKTEIVELPQPLEPNWITELTLRLPKTNEVDQLSRHEAIRYLNYAVSLAKQFPDGSVMKYALRSILKQPLDNDARIDALHYALQLCFYHPILIPLLSDILNKLDREDVSIYSEQLQALALQNALFHRSDGMVWIMHYLNIHGMDVRADVASEILRTKDSLGLLLLYLSDNENHKTNVTQLASSIVDGGDNFEMDQHWLLMYQLYLDGQIRNPYPDEDCFDILKDANISFIRLPEF